MNRFDFLRFIQNCKEDKSLPKYKDSATNLSEEHSTFLTVSGVNSELELGHNSRERQPLLSVLSKLILNLFNIKKADPTRHLIMLVKNSKELEELKLDEEELNTTIKKYRDAGQIAYAEGLEKHKSSLLVEQSLLRGGITRYITISDLNDFFNKHKNFTASWVKNFVKPLPDEAIEKKIEADSLCVFDNYFLVHPDISELNQPTKEEDPVLLGYVKHSKRAYYIHSWLYEDWGDLDIDLEKLMELGVPVTAIEQLRK